MRGHEVVLEVGNATRLIYLSGDSYFPITSTKRCRGSDNK